MPRKNYAGFSLIEVLLSLSILALLVTALTGALIYGQESSRLSYTWAQAVFLAEEGLEAVRNIRDSNFSLLSDGTHGLVVTGNHWNFSGTFDSTDIFTRSITISSVDAGRKEVTSTVTWQQNQQRQGTVKLVTRLNNWTSSTSIGSCTVYCQSVGSYSLGTCRENSVQCTLHSETYEPGGDLYCTGGENADTCCCQP